MTDSDRTFQVVVAQDQHLPGVVELWGANRRTLGMFPYQAFVEYTGLGQVLVAVDGDDHVAAYLLYRVPKGRASLTHFCVDSAHRGRGIARLLFDILRERTRGLEGIGLYCRREYEANAMWPKLGFIPFGEKKGRSKKGDPLTFWWFDHGHPSLFSLLQRRTMESKLVAVMDANIVFDLEDRTAPASEDSAALLEDWLQQEVVLSVAGETYVEIDRNREPRQRKKSRSLARRFAQLEINPLAIETMLPQLRPLIGDSRSDADESDVRQVAYALASDAQFFVTKDDRVLKAAEKIEALYGLSVLTPSDLIVHLDEKRRAVEYQPVRLAGSRIELRKVASGSEDALLERFLAHGQGERKGRLRDELRKALSSPTSSRCISIQDPSGDILGLMVAYESDPKRLEIPLLRLSSGRLAPTLARRLILHAVEVALSTNRIETLVSDPHLSQNTIEALQAGGFVDMRGGWVKFGLPIITSVHALKEHLLKLAEQHVEQADHLREVASAIQKASSATDQQFALSSIERSLWPLKLSDLDLPPFIIPIQARWAMDLFDEEIAKQILWGAEPALAFSGENAYYRAKKPGVLEAPGRILWYVSEDRKYSGSMTLKACSYLEEVVVGPAKDVFKQFERLGVFRWHDVLAAAKRDPREEIMGFRFAGTEVFKSPIPWTNLQQVLEETQGSRSQLQSPLRISPATFLRLYRMGTEAR